MVTAMTPQGTTLLAHLQKEHSNQFFDELIPLLDDFTDSSSGNIPCALRIANLLQTQTCSNHFLSSNRY